VDIRLTQAFRDVAVPEGLAERLLAGLAVKRPRSRRWLLVGGGLLAVAASLLLAVWLGGPRNECYSKECAIDQAIQAFGAGFTQPSHLLTNQSAPTAYPLSPWVRQFPGTRWRHVDDFLGCSGVVYELSGPGGTRAALFVVARDDVNGVGTAPAFQLPRSTGGFCASAWQEDGLLYVLVVEGDRSSYGRYLNPPRSPVA
jgi:hypothetical protein